MALAWFAIAFAASDTLALAALLLGALPSLPPIPSVGATPGSAWISVSVRPASSSGAEKRTEGGGIFGGFGVLASLLTVGVPLLRGLYD